MDQVQLTPHEQERLLIHVGADVAEKRRARGVRLNHPEAVALITSHILEGARAPIPAPQPILPRPMFGAIGRAPAANPFNFVAEAVIEDGLAERIGERFGVGKSFVPGSP